MISKVNTDKLLCHQIHENLKVHVPLNIKKNREEIADQFNSYTHKKNRLITILTKTALGNMIMVKRRKMLITI